MQDEGPFHDEPPPTEEELRAARALGDELDGARAAAPGSLTETALRARAAVREERPLDGAVVRRAVDAGLSRRRRASRTIAVTAFAAAAIAIAGLVVTRLATTASSGGPGTSETGTSGLGAPPTLELTALRAEPFPEGQPTSERVDRMARLAASDWWAAELARAQVEETR